jgi:hypothetical protein
LLLLITCSNYELETRLRKPEIRFPKVKNMGSIGGGRCAHGKATLKRRRRMRTTAGSRHWAVAR